MTQGFGPTNEPRDSAYGGYAHFNKGYDYGIPVGTPVAAVVGGRVIAAGPGNEGWGVRVWVQDDKGFVHNYGHLDSANVRVGDSISAGQVIARSGNSGNSTGPHLSYDVWKPGPNGNEYVDPGQFVGGNAVVNSFGTNGGYGGTGAQAGGGSARTPASNAQTINQLLQTYAAQNGLPKEFVHAALSIVAQESGFASDAHNNGSAFGTNEDSYGPWQINRKAHPDVSIEQAQDPVFSTMQRMPELVAAWKGLGGVAAFNADAPGFQARFHARAQGSILPTEKQANDALNIGYQVMQGQTPMTQGPVQAANFGGATGHTGASPFQAQPAATTASDPRVVRQMITDKVTQAIQAGDFVTANTYMQMGAGLNDLTGEMTPEQMAQLGLSRDQLEQARVQFNQKLAQDAAQHADSMAQTAWQQTGNWAQANADREVQMQKIANDYGISREQLAQSAQSNAVQAQLGFGRLGLDTANSAEQNALGRERLGFDRAAQAENNQLGRDRLGFDQANAGAQIDLGQQQGLAGERQSVMSGIINLLGQQVQNRSISQKEAEAALNALNQQYLDHPTQGSYRAGFEPGGLYSFLQKAITGKDSYDASQYQMRQFPLDLASMAKAVPDIDFGQAWKDAQNMLGANGMLDSVFKPIKKPTVPISPGTLQNPAAPQAAPTDVSGAVQAGVAQGAGMSGSTPAPGAGAMPTAQPAPTPAAVPAPAPVGANPAPAATTATTPVATPPTATPGTPPNEAVGGMGGPTAPGAPLPPTPTPPNEAAGGMGGAMPSNFTPNQNMPPSAPPGYTMVWNGTGWSAVRQPAAAPHGASSI